MRFRLGRPHGGVIADRTKCSGDGVKHRGPPRGRCHRPAGIAVSEKADQEAASILGTVLVDGWQHRFKNIEGNRSGLDRGARRGPRASAPDDASKSAAKPAAAISNRRFVGTSCLPFANSPTKLPNIFPTG